MNETDSRAAKTRLSFGDLQRELADSKGRSMTRAILDRLLRDYARELPVPEIVAGSRLWRIDDLESFRAVVARDHQVRR